VGGVLSEVLHQVYFGVESFLDIAFQDLPSTCIWHASRELITFGISGSIHGGVVEYFGFTMGVPCFSCLANGLKDYYIIQQYPGSLSGASNYNAVKGMKHITEHNPTDTREERKA